jgi:hypothetical protein
MSAATAKRGGAGLNCSSGQKGAKRSASGKKSSSAAHLSIAKTKDMHKTTAIEVVPKHASLSEKRRFAAMISWVKRRKGSEKKLPAAKGTVTANKRKSSVTAASVTPVKGKSKMGSMQKKHHPAAAAAAAPPPAKKRKVETSLSGTVSSSKEAQSVLTALVIRSNAAKRGWERRRSLAAANGDAGSTNTDASLADSDPAVEDTSNVEKKAVNKQRSEKDALAIRIAAAKLGWERRRNQIAAESSAGSSTSDDSSSAEKQSFNKGSGRSSVAKKTATASGKVYTATERRRAAIAGWEKRKTARMSIGLSSTSDVATSVATVQSMVLNSSPPTMPQLTREFKNYREGTKRSRRLAEESTESYEDEVRKTNQIVSYLRMSRGWLEFRPSSRRGTGTATYGYIPSSIASFIRNGTISQRTVLDHGTLGVHYALDWDGYGGLKDMIATFGEDYSPYPTKEMMEKSRDTEWELGDDLPWREVLEDDEKKLAIIAAREQESTAIDEDILFVAAILANLDRSAAKEHEQDDLEEVKSEEEDQSAARFPSHVALKNFDNIYDSSDEYDDSDSEDCKTQEVENALPHVAGDCLKQCKDPFKTPSAEILHQVYSHCHVGLC